MHAFLDPPHTCKRNQCWPAHHNHCFRKSKTPLRCTNKVRSSGTSPFICQMGQMEQKPGLASRSLTLRSLFLLYQVPKPCPSQESGSRLYAPQNKKGRNLRNIRFQLAENHLSLRIHSRNGNVPYLEPLIFPKGVKNRLTNKTWYSTVAAALKSCGPFLPLLAAVFCI